MTTTAHLNKESSETQTMTTTLTPPPSPTPPVAERPPMPPARTAGELAARLGVSPDRVRLLPPPGEATYEDAARLSERGEGLFELVDGTLVEKAMGFGESVLAGNLQTWFNDHIRRKKTAAFVAGEAGFAKAGRDRDLVRMPDVGVFLMSGFPPGTRIPDIKVAARPADLAVEVLSEGNTAEEMTRKRRELFAGGTREVWIADHRRRTVEVWRSPSEMTLLSDADTLEGGEVLPGFSLGVAEWFDSILQNPYDAAAEQGDPS